MQNENRKEIIEIWKTIISVQQHFNEIEMKIRGLFVTLLLGLFASIGFLLGKKLYLELSIVRIQFATVMPLFGCLLAYLFYFMDQHWYHRLLLGSVQHGINIEQKYKKEMPELSLSDAIGEKSPYKPTGLIWLVAYFLVGDARFRKTATLHSDGKIELFYKFVMFILIVTSVLLAICGGVEFTAR